MRGAWAGNAVQGTASADSWSAAGEHVAPHMARLYMVMLYNVVLPCMFRMLEHVGGRRVRSYDL